MLAVLLLDLGRVVPIDVLIDRVWGDSPPSSVRNNLYAYVASAGALFEVYHASSGWHILNLGGSLTLADL